MKAFLIELYVFPILWKGDPIKRALTDISSLVVSKEDQEKDVGAHYLFHGGSQRKRHRIET